MLPEELLTEEEVKRLAEAAENPRDRDFILTLYESGCRVGELISLRLKHVQFDNYGAVPGEKLPNFTFNRRSPAGTLSLSRNKIV